MVVVELRLGIKGVDVRRAAVHEQMHDLLGPGAKVWSARIQRIGRCRWGLDASGLSASGLAASGSAAGLVAQERSQTEQAHAHAAALEQLAARQKQVVKSWQMARHGDGHTA